MVLNTFFVCLLVLGTLSSSQIEAHHGSGPHLGEFISLKKSEANPHQVWKQNLLQALSSLPVKSHDSLSQFWVNTKAMIVKLRTCKPQTQLQLMNLTNLKFGNFEACVNATKDIADFEEFIIDTYDYFKDIVITFIDLFKSIFSCHNQPNIFDFGKCVISSLQAIGPNFDGYLDRAKFLISELQNDTTSLVTHVESCFGFHKNNISLNPVELVKLIEENEFIKESLNLIDNHC